MTLITSSIIKGEGTSMSGKLVRVEIGRNQYIKLPEDQAKARQPAQHKARAVAVNKAQPKPNTEE